MRTILFILLVILQASCGSYNSDNTSLTVHNDSSSIDSSHASKPKPKHDADNFFAFCQKNQTNEIFVGNNVELLLPIDINGCNPALSADGNILALTIADSTGSKIFLYDIAKKQSTQLKVSPMDCRSETFSPDGKYLAYSQCNVRNVWKVWLFDSKNSTKIMISSEADQNSDYKPTFSPDGKYIVCHNTQTVKIYSLNNGRPKLYKTIDCVDLCQRNDLAISPDSKFQLTADHNHIVFKCVDFSTGDTSFNRLIIYDIQKSYISDIIDDNKSCADFQISDDGHIYYAKRVDGDCCNLYMTSLVNMKSVRVSTYKLGPELSFSLAY